MKTIEELSVEINQMLSIWYSAKTYFNDNIYLLNPDTAEERDIVLNDLFLLRAKYSASVMTVLEMHKLFGGKNDDFTFEKLFNKLINN